MYWIPLIWLWFFGINGQGVRNPARDEGSQRAAKIREPWQELSCWDGLRPGEGGMGRAGAGQEGNSSATAPSGFKHCKNLHENLNQEHWNTGNEYWMSVWILNIYIPYPNGYRYPNEYWMSLWILNICVEYLYEYWISVFNNYRDVEYLYRCWIPIRILNIYIYLNYYWIPTWILNICIEYLNNYWISILIFILLSNIYIHIEFLYLISKWILIIYTKYMYIEYLYLISIWVLNTYMNTEYLCRISKLILDTYMNIEYL